MIEDRTRIQTGRSWRDLPASPPIGDMPEYVPAPSGAIVPPPAPPRPRWWWFAGALGVLVLGVLVGAWAPWQDEGGSSSGTAPTTTLRQEPIIPPGPPDTTVPETTPPTDQSPFAPGSDPFGDLRDFLEEQFQDGPGGDFSFDFQGLIVPESIPDDYQITSQSLQVTPEGLRESLRLQGPSGRVDIVAILRAGAELPDGGEAVELRGTSGVIADGPGGVSLTWIEGERVEVTLAAPAGTEHQMLLDLAEALEVVP